MTIVGYDHVQVAIPIDSESMAREFYGGLLAMIEQSKPAALAARGGCWFRSGHAVLHLGVQDPFVGARKAHPAFLVDDLNGLRARLQRSGHHCVESDGDLPGVRRFHTSDPFGNRLEFQQA